MVFQIKGHQVNVGEAFSSQYQEKISNLFNKHNITMIKCSVSISKLGHGHFFSSIIQTHISKDTVVRCEGSGRDAYDATDQAYNRLAKKMKRYKERLRGRCRRYSVSPKENYAMHSIFNIQEEKEADTNGLSPPIIAHIDEAIPQISVEEAVMNLDLTEEPIFIFKNSSHGNINVVYRRTDGNIGWVDPYFNDK